MSSELTSRVEVQTVDGGTQVSISGPNSQLELGVLSFISLGVSAFFFFILFDVIFTPRFPGIGEVIFAIVCALIWRQLAWKAVGVENILIGEITLGHHKRLMGKRWSRSKYYELAAITRAWWGANEIQGSDGPNVSAVSFSYGRRTIHIFPYASRYEASFILDALEKTAGIPQK